MHRRIPYGSLHRRLLTHTVGLGSSFVIYRTVTAGMNCTVKEYFCLFPLSMTKVRHFQVKVKYNLVFYNLRTPNRSAIKRN
jgi:hypothetical protein